MTLFVALALPLCAQNDQKARTLLEETSKKMQSFQTLSASFTFTMDNPKMNIREKNSGSLLLKGSKYQVKLPGMGMQIFSDGKSVWNYMEEAQQVTVTHAGDLEEGSIDPTAIFNIYQEGYLYQFVGEKNINGKTIATVDLFPTDKTKDFTKLTVNIDKARLLVSSLITHGKEGNQYGIYVDDLKTNLPVSDTEFVFNAALHKGVEVVDFR